MKRWESEVRLEILLLRCPGDIHSTSFTPHNAPLLPARLDHEHERRTAFLYEYLKYYFDDYNKYLSSPVDICLFHAPYSIILRIRDRQSVGVLCCGGHGGVLSTT